MGRRKIAVFTSTRADAAPLRPVLEAIWKAEQLEPVVLATGTHLSGTSAEPSLHQFTAGLDVELHLSDMGTTSDRAADLAQAGSRILTAVSAFLEDGKPDAMLVLGDRWELLSVGLACVLHGTPLVHLHGGEVSEGAFDERVRHAITKLADLHLCAHQNAARRIRQLGEEAERVVITGAPALDDLVHHEPISLGELSAALDAPLARPFGLVTYHAPTSDRGMVAGRASAVLQACAERLSSVVITAPGLDPGRGDVLAEIERWVAQVPSLHYRPHLGPHYRDALFLADVMVGNSSSGIIEAATARLPVVDVGERQRGRLKGDNVIHADENVQDVDAALARALSPGFRDSLSDLVNPYGAGNAAPLVVHALDLLQTLPARKRFADGRCQDMPS